MEEDHTVSRTNARNFWLLLGSCILVGLVVFTFVVFHASGSGINRPYISPLRATSSIAEPKAPVGVCTLTATQFGASSATTDNASALDKAFKAGVGGTVCIPAGTWRVTSQLTIPGSETVTGAGAGRTILLQTVSDHNLLQARSSYIVVENLTLDTQTYNGGIAFATGGSHVTLRNADVRSGSQPGHFAIYYAGPHGATPTAPHYSVGNVIQDVVVSDEICDDGVSWSFQSGGHIDNVHETGSRLALYVDNGTVIDNYSYTPGPCTAADNGYWITPPSESITIHGFVSLGAGGKICPNLSEHKECTDITVMDERAPNGALDIGDVNGLAVIGSTVKDVHVITSTGASGSWSTSSPQRAFCSGGPVTITGLFCG